MKTQNLFKQILPIAVSIALIFGTLACNKSNKKSNGSETAAVTESSVGAESDDDVAKLENLDLQTDENNAARDYYSLSVNFSEFYSNPNYDIALDGLSYEELRLLRSIPYARNHHWFKEGEICEKLCTIKQYKLDMKPVAKQFTQEVLDSTHSQYWQTWFDNYPKTYSLITLNDDEKAFVKRVDERLAEFERRRHVEVEGVKLPNSQLLYNKSYVDIADAKFWQNLQKQNFAIADDQYSQLFNPYELYDKLPVYVTTDLYLHTYHMYFSWLLKRLETNHFLPAIQEMCKTMADSSYMAAFNAKSETEKMLAETATEFYAIAANLASGAETVKVPAAAKKYYDSEMRNIMTEIDGRSKFMGVDNFAYSLFKPRGNYTRSEESKQYFKSMMWLQTARFNLQQTLYLAYQFKHSSDEVKKLYFSVHDAISFLMGEPDNISITELADILGTELGITSVEDICNPQNVKNADTIIKRKFSDHAKIQTSVKDVVVNFMPQRYVPDNEVLGAMHDSVPNAARAFPSGLDVFDAFGSTTAGNIIDTTDNNAMLWNKFESRRDEMHQKFSHFGDFNATMYNKWFESLIVLQKKEKEWPAHMKTSAWERKNMNAALASWAELKHDAVLYSKQQWGAEMGDGGDDDYPVYLPNPDYFDNYVEPNIKFWEKLKEVLELNVEMLKKSGYYYTDNRMQKETRNLIDAVDFSISIAKKELKDEKLTENENFRLSWIGGEFESLTLLFLSDDDYRLDGWYEVEGADTCIAVVADVFTRAIENCGKNGILYAATAKANTIYVVVERNSQIYLTRGGVYDYREFTTPLDESRLTDEEWQAQLRTNPTKGRPDWIKNLFTNKLIKINKKAGDRDYPFWMVKVTYEYNEETKRYKHIEELGTDSLTDYWYKNAWWGKYY